MQINNIQTNSLNMGRFENTQTVKKPFTTYSNTAQPMTGLPKNRVSFKGSLPAKVYDKATNGIAKGLGNFLDTKFAQGMVKFFNGESDNKVLRSIGKAINIKKKWFQHAIAAESIYLTSFYMYNTKKSKAIPEDQKKPMMINQALVTTLCTGLGYTLDSKISKVFNKAKHIFTVSHVTQFAEKAKDHVAEAIKNTKDPKIIDNVIKKPLKEASGIANGISKLKSVLVFGFIYRYFSPVFITPIANRVSEWFDKKKDKKASLK